MRNVFGCLCSLMLLVLMAQGCQNQPQPTNAQPLPLTDPRVKFTNKPIRDTSPLNSFDDPCAGQLQDLGGPFLAYFKVNQHGPSKIEDLAPFALAGVPLQTTCPVSHQPYLCSSDGLSAPNENIRIYIYDAQPVHNGERWCLVNDGAIAGALGLNEIHLPEAKFQKFMSSSTTAPAAPARP